MHILSFCKSVPEHNYVTSLLFSKETSYSLLELTLSASLDKNTKSYKQGTN
jgi:hypothetical protein